MNRVNGIFCYNRVLLNGRWHMPALSCSSSRAEGELLRKDDWIDVMECRSGRPVTIRELLCDENSATDFPEQLVLLNESADLSQFTADDRHCVLMAQQHTYIITDTDLSQIHMPCFFSTEYCNLSLFRATATLSDYLLCDLPEEVAYRKRCLEYDKGDYMLFGIGVGGKIRPPVRVWFPMEIEGTAGVYPGVFRINEWLGHRAAQIEGFVAATPADIRVGDKIARTYEERRCSIGVISNSLEVFVP